MKLSLDPGEACGWATWTDDGKNIDCGTDPLWQVIQALAFVKGVAPPENVQAEPHLQDAFGGVDEIICEDWALYPWKAEELGRNWDTCRTARGIGAVELICLATATPLTLQPASIKDSAVAGGAEQLFDTPLRENRHANDAKMHGVYFFARQSPEYAPSTAPAEGNDPE